MVNQRNLNCYFDNSFNFSMEGDMYGDKGSQQGQKGRYVLLCMSSHIKKLLQLGPKRGVLL